MKKEVLEKLIEFIKIDTYAYKKENILEAHAFIKKYLDKQPIKWNQYPSEDKALAPFLVGKSLAWDEKKPTISLVGHVDIVYPDISKFKIELTGTRLLGAGSADMKGGVMVILETVKELAKADKFSNINIVLTSDEEQYRTEAYPDLGVYAKESDFVLVYEGPGSFEIEPDHKIKKIVTSRKGVLFYKLKAVGPGGHSGVLSQKEDRHSAIHELLAQSTDLLNQADDEKGTTINVGTIQGGQAVNILAPEAEIGFDVRMNSVKEFERIERKIAVLEPHDKLITLETNRVVFGSPVEETEVNKNLFRLAKKAGVKIGLEIIKETRSGASDMNRFAYFDKSTAMIDFLGPSGGGEHTKNEFLYLESFDPSLNLSAGLIKEIQSKDS